MATPASQLDQLLATTFQKVRPTLVDQITNDTPLLAALDSKSQVTEDGGTVLRRPLMYALNSSVATFSGYDLIDTTPQGGLGYAEYNWRNIAGSITIAGEEERKNSGAAQIIGLLVAKTEQLRLSFEDVLNRMLFADGTGNGGKDLLGLQAIITDSGTLGGIDPSTETWWKSTVIGSASSNTGRVDLTVDAGVKGLNNVFNTLTLNRSRVDFELTTQGNFEAYEQLMVPAVRFVQTKMADKGFESVAHKTAEVILDPDCPGAGAPDATNGGFWYFINSTHLEFVRHSSAWMKNGAFIQPVNQDARAMLVISMGNLITDCRRAFGVIKNVKVS